MQKDYYQFSYKLGNSGAESSHGKMKGKTLLYSGRITANKTKQIIQFMETVL